MPVQEQDLPFVDHSRATMISSKLTTKAQTTIPKPVRAALRLQPGDALVYQIADRRVILTKGGRGDKIDVRFCAFSEWDSEADMKGYAEL